MNKPKVLILQGILSSYNIPIYEILSNSTELSVAYVERNESKKVLPFSVIKLSSIEIGCLTFVNHLYSLCSNYDVVVFMPDLHYVSYVLLPFIKRTYKVIPWSIGIRASYKRRYDLERPKNFLDKIYGLIYRKSDAVLFYMKQPISYWTSTEIERERFFVAHNTVQISNKFILSNKSSNSILFVGTLYGKKGINELIEAYADARNLAPMLDFPTLDIIGDGPEYSSILNKIKELNLEGVTTLYGAIYDEEEILIYFSKALLCVSPNQAGLSVLKSMGYGVPFVTRINAITGGERLNIEHGVNGFLYNEKRDLTQILIEAVENPKKIREMSFNAKKYYDSHATPLIMARGFLDAIEYTLSDK